MDIETACAKTGLCAYEQFDKSPYTVRAIARALTRPRLLGAFAVVIDPKTISRGTGYYLLSFHWKQDSEN